MWPGTRSRTYRTEAFGAAQVIRRLNSTRRLTIGIAAHRRVAAGRSRTPRRRPRRGTDRKRQLALSRFRFATIVAPLDAEGAPPKSLSLIAPSGGQVQGAPALWGQPSYPYCLSTSGAGGSRQRRR